MSAPIYITPTLANGMAMSPEGSAFPRMWDRLACLYLPSAGVQGASLTDFSGRRRPATFVGFDGSMSPTSGWSGGRCGLALHLDGSNDYAQTSFVSTWTHTSQFTLWSMLRTTDSDRGIPFGDFLVFSAGNPGVTMEITAAGKLRAFVFTGSTSAYKDYSGATTMNDGNWHNVAIVYDGSGASQALTLYLDGKAETPTLTRNDTLNGSLSNPLGYRIGVDNRSSPGVVHFLGSILGVGAWDRALSAQEILDLHRGASPCTPRRRIHERRSGLTHISGTRQCIFNVRQAISGTRAASWNVRQQVAGSRAASWNVRQSVSGTRSASWNVRQSVSGTRAASWNVRQRISGTRSASWNVQSDLVETEPVGQITGSVRASKVGSRIRITAVTGKVKRGGQS